MKIILETAKDAEWFDKTFMQLNHFQGMKLTIKNESKYPFIFPIENIKFEGIPFLFEWKNINPHKIIQSD